MTFATTGILDSFTRGDTGPPPSASWTDIDSGMKVVSNQAAGNDATYNWSHWNTSYGPLVSPGAEVYVTIPTVPASSLGWAVYLSTVPTPKASNDGYSIWVGKAAGTDEFYVVRQDDGADTALGTAPDSQEFAAGDALGLEIIGNSNNIKAYRKASGGSWAQIGATRSDATYCGAGVSAYPGLATDNTTARFDDFGGGTVAGSSVGQTYKLPCYNPAVL